MSNLCIVGAFCRQKFPGKMKRQHLLSMTKQPGHPHARDARRNQQRNNTKHVHLACKKKRQASYQRKKQIPAHDDFQSCCGINVDGWTNQTTDLRSRPLAPEGGALQFGYHAQLGVFLALFTVEIVQIIVVHTVFCFF